jgi:hypothetical protein
MINVGEQTGGLDEMLTRIADFYDEEVDAAVEAALSALEPVMIVFLGVIVGGMIVAMYLPIFVMINAVGRQATSFARPAVSVRRIPLTGVRRTNRIDTPRHGGWRVGRVAACGKPPGAAGRRPLRRTCRRCGGGFSAVGPRHASTAEDHPPPRPQNLRNLAGRVASGAFSARERHAARCRRCDERRPTHA